MFKYNSYHKIFTALLIIGLVTWQFVTKKEMPKSFNNGQSKCYGSVINGKNNGVWVWFHENGKKRMEGNFINGKREGIWKIWNEKGNLISEAIYKNDQIEAH